MQVFEIEKINFSSPEYIVGCDMLEDVKVVTLCRKLKNGDIEFILTKESKDEIEIQEIVDKLIEWFTARLVTTNYN